MGSTRLPGKVLKEVNGLPLIVHIYRRLLACKELDGVGISWGVHDDCEVLEKLVDRYGLFAHAGMENDLINRHRCAAASIGKYDAFVRITADCLFHDPAYIDAMVAEYRNHYPKYRGLTNWYPHRTISEGLDAEIYSMELMAELDRDPKCPREDFATYAALNGHVKTRWMPLDKLQESSLTDEQIKAGMEAHLSIDTQEDLDRAEKMLKILTNDEWRYSETLKAYQSVMAEE